VLFPVRRAATLAQVLAIKKEELMFSQAKASKLG